MARGKAGTGRRCSICTRYLEPKAKDPCPNCRRPSVPAPDAGNAYRPWEERGETEVTYWKRRFLEECARAEAAEASAATLEAKAKELAREVVRLGGEMDNLRRREEANTGYLIQRRDTAEARAARMEAALWKVRELLAHFNPKRVVQSIAIIDAALSPPKLSPSAKSDSGPPAPPEGDGDLRGLLDEWLDRMGDFEERLEGLASRTRAALGKEADGGE